MQPTMEDQATHLASELVRYWRAERSQFELSLDLGFSSNVVGNWESGRSACTVLSALRMAELRHPGALRLVLQAIPTTWPDGLRLDTRPGVALLLDRLMHGISLQYVTSNSQLSRHKVGRWLRGDAEPRLHEFVQLLMVTHDLVEVFSLLAPGLNMPDELPIEVSATEAETMFGLRTSRYLALPEHDDEALAALVGHPPEDIRRELAHLERLKAIHRVDGRYAFQIPVQLSRRTPGSAHQQIAARLARHTPRVSRGLLLVLSPEDLQEVEDMLKRYVRELRHVRADERLPDEDRSYVTWVSLTMAPIGSDDLP
ncbi:MAG: hypothetical protein AAFV53_09070 [Myxococcota bacterium]